MKRVTSILTILFLFLTSNSFAQHFVLAYTDYGQDHMNITIVTATIGGVALEAGDEIAAFDGAICCGKVTLTQPIVLTNPSTHGTVLASRKDDGLSNGYTAGHTITYKFWDSSKNLEISGITAEYFEISGSVIPAPTYTIDGSAIVKLTVSAPVNQTPASNAGPDQSVNEGDNVTLDGSASSDPDGNALTYLWTAPTGITLNSGTVAKPTFTAPDVTQDTPYIFSLIVNDGTVNSPADQVTITVRQPNTAPIANAGPDQTVNEVTTVTLDGSSSSDAEGNTLSYIWTAPAGITLSSGTAANPTFTAPDVIQDTPYVFSLIVNDGTVNSPADQVIVTVKQVNKAPVANAGIDRSVIVGTAFSLDGSLSSDADGNTLTYSWTAPAGITLNSATVAKPTFTAPDVTQDTPYTFSLIVNDGTVNSTADQVIITVKRANTAPVANAGNDQTVNEGVLVTLDGSFSSDVDGTPLTYIWTAPAGIILSSATVAKPTYTAPEVTQDTPYTFSLIVNDGIVNSPADQIVVTVRQVNKAPVANAGTDQMVNEGATVTLDGSFSADPDGAVQTYTWTAPAGITLSSATIAKPTFTAPEVMQDTPYTFSLIVNDGSVNSPVDQVSITVKQVNKAPVAKAGTDQSVNEGATVTLDGSSSSDPDNNTLTYIWTAPAGITMSSATVAKPTFTAPEVNQDTPYTFSMIVNDGTVNSPADQVVISIKNVDKAPYVKNPIKDFSVNKGANPQVVDLKTIFSDDDIGDLLNYAVTANSNTQVVTPVISEFFLVLSFSAENTGLSEIEVTASSNGKQVQSRFKVEVKIQTGTNAKISDRKMIIYPNPTSGKIKIVFDQIHHNETYLTVCDVTGKIILKQIIQNKEEWIDLKGNPPGLYLVKTSLNNTWVQKVILQ